MEIGPELINQQQLAVRINQMGEQITRDLQHHRHTPLTLVPVLTGALVFTADLIRSIPVKMSIRPVTTASYHGATESSGKVDIRGDLPTDLAGAHVLITDDILDSGRTLGLLSRVIRSQNPASLRIAVLLRKNKPLGREEHVDADYVGFDIEDEFVVGYGLDYDGYFRNHPAIGLLRAPDTAPDTAPNTHPRDTLA